MLLGIEQLRELGEGVFRNVGVPEETAACIVRALIDAELDGIPSHGFSRIPFYADQAASGKVRGDAVPSVTRPAPSCVVVDAGCGFAFPALDKALEAAMEQADAQGVSFFAVRRSHHCGVLGRYAEAAARRGMASLLFSNTPAAMAPWNGRAAVFGTNPLAFGCPRKDRDPLIVDMSLSKVARGKIMAARQRGERIPEGWALDERGEPTTDPEAALKGTMVPAGDAKGAALALAVEILAAAIPGANYGFQASSFFTPEGPAPAIGQSGILIRPDVVNPDFATHVETLFAAMTAQEGVRLPGERRFALRARHREQGVELHDALYKDLAQRAARDGR